MVVLIMVVLSGAGARVGYERLIGKSCRSLRQQPSLFTCARAASARGWATHLPTDDTPGYDNIQFSCFIVKISSHFTRGTFFYTVQ